MIEWFDCFAEFGRRTVPGPLQVEDAAGLVALFAEIGVQRALVTHPSLREQHAALGNARIVAETRPFPQLASTWAILPPQTEELGTVDDFLAAMAASGVRALWAYPVGYLLNAATFAPLFDAMIAHRIPLLVKVDAFGGHPSGWAALGQLLAEAPGLRVIAMQPGVWGQDRYFRPLIERFPDLYLCTALYALEGGLRAFCAKYGPGRLLYGSGFPDNQPGGGYFQVLHAGLDEDALAAVAGGNLRRLLEEVTL